MDRPFDGGPQAVLHQRLEELLNKVLTRDERTAHRLRELGSAAVALRLRGAERGIVVHVEDGRLSLAGETAQAADVLLVGGIADFAAMARARRSGGALAAGKIDIQGDLATARRVEAVFEASSIDWEDILAGITGDVVAHQLGRGLRGGLQFTRDTHATLERDLGEYLRYEARLLPTPGEIDDFVRDVAALAEDVERLAARIARARRDRTR